MSDNSYLFPQDPVLCRLLEAARAVPDSQIAIWDAFGFEKSYAEMLGDIVRTRESLRDSLSSSAFDERGLLLETSPYVTALTRTGYEFAVAFFAVRALGGAFVPLDAKADMERVASCISKAGSSCVLVDKGRLDEAGEILSYVGKTEGKSLELVPIVCNSQPVPAANIEIDKTLRLDPDGPGFVVNTSGTTGYSKHVVIRRACFSSSELAGPGSAVVNYNESHWLGGTKNIIDGLVTGKTVYALQCPASAADVLEQFMKHRITHFVFNPALMRGMKSLLLDGASSLTNEKKDSIAAYFSGLTHFLCIGGLVEQSTVDFWTKIIPHPYLNRYGTTELAGLPTLGGTKLNGSVGKIAPGIQVKLSQGTYGQLLIKSPDRFLCYLGEDDKTRDAFDEEGFYKTGDIAELKDGELLFHGRERDDYIIFDGTRISGFKVERCLMGLPYVADACVVAVPISEGKQLCGAVIKLEDEGEGAGKSITLSQVRRDLSNSLDVSMLPTVLRLIRDGEELPRTATGKPIKRQVIEDYFYAGDCGRDWFAVNNPPSSVECYHPLPVTIQ